MAGGRVLHASAAAPEFHLDLDAIEALAPRARLIILSHPSNPTGVVYTSAELAQVASIARRHELLVLSDEAYDHLVYEPTRFVSTLAFDELADRLLYLQSFSKTYSMTGWRIGYILAPPALAPACGTVHRMVNGPVSSAVQRAALAALSLGDEWSREMLGEYDHRRALVLDAMQRSPRVEVRPPQGAFYRFVGHPRGVSSEQMADIAAEHGVAVRPGSEYGSSGEGFVRIAFTAGREELIEGIDGLLRAFDSAADVSYRTGRPAEPGRPRREEARRM